MTEPVETTLEEASRCPKCSEPSKFDKEQVARDATTRGAKLRFYRCMNSRCRWYDTICRIVQVNPDGSIPPPVTRREKMFPAIPDMSKEINERLARQLAAETHGDAETRR